MSVEFVISGNYNNNAIRFCGLNIALILEILIQTDFQQNGRRKKIPSLYTKSGFAYGLEGCSGLYINFSIHEINWPGKYLSSKIREYPGTIFNNLTYLKRNRFPYQASFGVFNRTWRMFIFSHNFLFHICLLYVFLFIVLGSILYELFKRACPLWQIPYTNKRIGMDHH